MLRRTSRYRSLCSAGGLSCILRLLPGMLAVTLLASTSPTQAAVADDFAGLRSEAMGGAHRGLGTSNDAMMLNPGAMGFNRGYSLDVLYGFSPLDKVSRLGITAVDGKSGPVAGGAGYTHDRGSGDNDTSLHRFYLGLAYALTPALSLGITGRHVRGDLPTTTGEVTDVSTLSGDVGMAVRLGALGLGLSYKNLLRSGGGPLLQRVLGTGVHLGLTEALNVVADLEINLQTRDTRSYHAGIEYFVADVVPLRAGWARRPFTNLAGNQDEENVLSGGLGYVAQAGALEGTYTQSLERNKNWQAILAVKFFL